MTKPNVKKRATQKKAEPTTISLRDFRQWLCGVEDMQESDWVPDLKQWSIIRQKLDSIYVESPSTEASLQPSHSHRTHTALPVSSLDVDLKPNPRGDYPISTPVPISRSPNNPMMSSLDDGTPTKTLDIDTTGGTYDSAFQ